MSRIMRTLHSEKGLTLLELTVVAAILAILAGLTAVAVTGSASAGKGAVLEADIAEIQKAVNRFNGEHPKGFFPTVNGCLPGETLSAGRNQEQHHHQV